MKTALISIQRLSGEVLARIGSARKRCWISEKNEIYMVGMAHTSCATAQRELSDLVQKGILIKLPGGGRSSSYDLDWSKCSE